MRNYYVPHMKINSTSPLVSIVDDDESIRQAMESLLMGFGFQVEPFSSAEKFLNSPRLYDTDCLILDIQMPGMNGLKLQYQLAARDHPVPIIFLTAHGSKYNETQAMRQGAYAFLRKPFNARELLHTLCAALHLPPIEE